MHTLKNLCESLQYRKIRQTLVVVDLESAYAALLVKYILHAYDTNAML